MPNSLFRTSFKLESNPMCFHWHGEIKKRGFTRLHQEEAILPNVFQNSFNFIGETASLKKLLHQLFQKKLKLCQIGPYLINGCIRIYSFCQTVLKILEFLAFVDGWRKIRVLKTSPEKVPSGCWLVGIF